MTMCSPSSYDAEYEEKMRKHPINEYPRTSWHGRTLKRIVVHYGPLTIDHPAYIGSKFNVLVEWENCHCSTETLENIIGMELEKVLKYSNDCGLFNDAMWSNHFPAHIRRQIPCVLPPVQSIEFRHDLDHCRAVATALRKSFDECVDFRTDDSCRSLRDGVCEIFVDASTMGSACYEMVVESNLELFQRCFKGRKRKLKCPIVDVSIQSDEEQSQPLPDDIQSHVTPTDTCVYSPMAIDEFDASESDCKATARRSIATIRSFAIRTVLLDLRTKSDDVDSQLGGCGVEFGNFSLLTSRPKTPPQFRHVDAYSYETQFVMALQPNTEATATYLVPDPLETPKDVVRLWTELAAAYAASQRVSPTSLRPRRQSRSRIDSSFIASSLLNVMNQDETITFWIRHYGKVLCRPHRMIPMDVATPANWNIGSVLCVPGGVVHGAPRNGKFRAVLFFTGAPLAAGTYQYRANDQFSGPTLAATIAHRVWDRVDERCREFLRSVLHQCVEEEPCTSVDFASYLREEIGSCHEVGEILRTAQEAKVERRRRRGSGSPRDP